MYRSFPQRIVGAAVGLLLAIVSLPAHAQVVTPIEPTGVTPVPGKYSCAVKFVCGFNNTNVGVVKNSDGSQFEGGEATVKLGNYATDINIFNPGKDTLITKKFILLNRGGNPIGREPMVQGPFIQEELELMSCKATMDDCNHIAELLFGPPAVPTPLPLLIGFLVLQSKEPLDVTAVYTSELCSDWVTLGGAGMCNTPPGAFGFSAFGVGMSIDVDQVDCKFIPD